MEISGEIIASTLNLLEKGRRYPLDNRFGGFLEAVRGGDMERK
jgi:hypothetical protein